MGEQTAFDALVASVGRQFVTVWNAPIPFLLVVGVVSFAIWRILEWRYGAIIERLRDERDSLKGKVDEPVQAPPDIQAMFPGGLARAETGGKIYMANNTFTDNRGRIPPDEPEA